MPWWGWPLLALSVIVEGYVHLLAWYGWHLMGAADDHERAKRRSDAALTALSGGDIRFGLPHHDPKAEAWNRR